MIYFIQDESTKAVKIGFTAGRPEDRLKQLQCGCPGMLKLIGTLNGSEIEERALHAKYSHLNVRGEWFRIDDELGAFVFGASKIPGRRGSVALGAPRAVLLDRLIYKVPQIKSLISVARLFRPATDITGFCALDIWFGYRNHVMGLKWLMGLCVGHGSANPDLWVRSSEAYDIAYDAIYESLPDCKNCGCLGSDFFSTELENKFTVDQVLLHKHGYYNPIGSEKWLETEYTISLGSRKAAESI